MDEKTTKWRELMEQLTGADFRLIRIALEWGTVDENDSEGISHAEHRRMAELRDLFLNTEAGGGV